MRNRNSTPLEINQLNAVFLYLQEHVATASMVSKATGIPQKCITWYKRELEVTGKLWEIEKKRCQITGFSAWYLTTDQNLIPVSSQLEMDFNS
jgi:hypothetical protein